MTVFVDDMHLSSLGRLGRMKMLHMIADITEELLAMATSIGLSHRYLQHAGTAREHFDVSKSYRERAIEHGAVPITMRELVMKIRARREVG